MDEDDEGAAETRRRDRNPKQKYIQMLQDVADRARSEIQIDLDDLDTVRIPLRW
jgi:DNA replication licensing factor MCM7